MATLVAIAYPDEGTAEEAREAVRRLETGQVIQAEQVAAITRDTDGKYYEPSAELHLSAALRPKLPFTPEQTHAYEKSTKYAYPQLGIDGKGKFGGRVKLPNGQFQPAENIGVPGNFHFRSKWGFTWGDAKQADISFDFRGKDAKGVDPTQQQVYLVQLVGRRRLDRTLADPPRRVDLVPAVSRVVDPGADDLPRPTPARHTAPRRPQRDNPGRSGRPPRGCPPPYSTQSLLVEGARA